MVCVSCSFIRGFPIWYLLVYMGGGCMRATLQTTAAQTTCRNTLSSSPACTPQPGSSLTRGTAKRTLNHPHLPFARDSTTPSHQLWQPSSSIKQFTFAPM
jgi:hypothetical protein